MSKKENTDVILEAQQNVIYAPRPKLQEDFRSNNFYNVPTSPTTDACLKVLVAGKDLAQLPSKAKKISHSQLVEVKEKGQQRQVIFKSNKNTVTLEIADVEKLTGSNKTAKKMFLFTLIKANEQSLHNGVLSQNYVSFPIQELIDIGFYSSPQSARKGFDVGTSILTSLKVKGTVQKGGKNTEEQSAIEVLFTGANRDRGQCTIYLNERINWGFVAAFYTLLPKYAFALPNKAFDLLYCIFYLARQNVKEIHKKGYFNISLKTIQARLDLPNEEQAKNPYRDIRQPIDEAIKNISSVAKSTEFIIEIVADFNAPIAEYIHNGYLRVSLKGEYAKDFIGLSQNKVVRIEKSQKRKESVIDKAKSIKTTKKIHSEEISEEEIYHTN